MNALVYRRSVPLYLLSGLLSRLFRRRFFPKAAPVALVDTPFTPRPGWVTLKPLLCGICGSDLSLLRGVESVLLEPYGSFPAILGHEVVAEVLEAPADSGFLPGERVAVEPLLPCAVRGLPPCRSCSRGDYHLCEQFTTEPLAAGPVLGYNRSVGGGMAALMSVHPGQLFRLPADMPLRRPCLWIRWPRPCNRRSTICRARTIPSWSAVRASSASILFAVCAAWALPGDLLSWRGIPFSVSWHWPAAPTTCS